MSRISRYLPVEEENIEEIILQPIMKMMSTTSIYNHLPILYVDEEERKEEKVVCILENDTKCGEEKYHSVYVDDNDDDEWWYYY